MAQGRAPGGLGLMEQGLGLDGGHPVWGLAGGGHRTLVLENQLPIEGLCSRVSQGVLVQGTGQSAGLRRAGILSTVAGTCSAV